MEPSTVIHRPAAAPSGFLTWAWTRHSVLEASNDQASLGIAISDATEKHVLAERRGLAASLSESLCIERAD